MTAQQQKALDALYALDNVLTVNITMPHADWDNLRKEEPKGGRCGFEFIGSLYWPVVLLGSVCMLATLYHLSVPARTRWRADLPGAAITVALWVGGSVL